MLHAVNMFESWLFVHIYNKGKKYGSFVTKLDNAHILVDGKVQAFLFHKFIPFGGNRDSLSMEGNEADNHPGVLL